MILVMEEASLICKLLEIAYDRLLPYENAEKSLLPRFNRLVLQADYVSFGPGAFDTPSALAYAASIRGNEVDLPEPRILVRFNVIRIDNGPTEIRDIKALSYNDLRGLRSVRVVCKWMVRYQHIGWRTWLAIDQDRFLPPDRRLGLIVVLCFVHHKSCELRIHE
jgi:hypothetical protein